MNASPALLERIDKLERQNRRVRLIGAAAAVLTGAALIIGQTAPSAGSAGGRVIEAEKFVLRGPDGYVRGEWSATSNGNALMTMYDRDKNKRIEWAVFPSGTAVLDLADASGNGRLTWQIKKDGQPMLSVHDGQAKVRARWGVFATGKTALLLFDEQGNALWSAP